MNRWMQLEAASWISITSARETHVTDFDHNTMIYQFNEYGNVICMVDDHGQAQYYQYADADMSDLDPPPNQMTASSPDAGNDSESAHKS